MPTEPSLLMQVLQFYVSDLFIWLGLTIGMLVVGGVLKEVFEGLRGMFSRDEG